MINWLRSTDFFPRPVVFLDDEMKHVKSFVKDIHSRDSEVLQLMGRCTAVILDRPGLDTERAVVELLSTHQTLQVVAGPFEEPMRSRLKEIDNDFPTGQLNTGGILEMILRKNLAGIDGGSTTYSPMAPRFLELPDEAINNENALARFLYKLIRPGGIFICDIELRTLNFCGDDDSVYYGLRAASTACEKQAEMINGTKQPAARLMVVSNKEKFGLCMDRKLDDVKVKVDDNDILRKIEDSEDVIDNVIEHSRAKFPWQLDMRHPHDNQLVTHWAGRSDHVLLNAEFDLVVWPAENGYFEVSGRLVKPESRIREDSARGRVLVRLVEDCLSISSDGLGFDEMSEIIENEGEKQTPSQVIGGIRNTLDDEKAKGILPHGKGGRYQLGDSFLVAQLRAF